MQGVLIHLVLVDLVIIITGIFLGSITASISETTVGKSRTRPINGKEQGRFLSWRFFIVTATAVWCFCVFHSRSPQNGFPFGAVQSLPRNQILSGEITTYSIINSLLDMVIGLLFIAIADSDARFHLIPNSLLLYLVPSILAQKVMSGHSPLLDALFGGLAGFTALYVPFTLRPGALGAGDVKLALVSGLYLGKKYVLPGLSSSFIVASIYLLPLLIIKKKKKTDPVPMGVFLSSATLIWVLISKKLST